MFSILNLFLFFDHHSRHWTRSIHCHRKLNYFITNTVYFIISSSGTSQRLARPMGNHHPHGSPRCLTSPAGKFPLFSRIHLPRPVGTRHPHGQASGQNSLSLFDAWTQSAKYTSVPGEASVVAAQPSLWVTSESLLSLSLFRNHPPKSVGTRHPHSQASGQNSLYHNHPPKSVGTRHPHSQASGQNSLYRNHPPKSVGTRHPHSQASGQNLYLFLLPPLNGSNFAS